MIYISGHSYTVYGPLINGVTTVMFESIPTYPDPYRYIYIMYTNISLYVNVDIYQLTYIYNMLYVYL